MTKTEAMKRLEAFGTEQNRKVYARHGVKPPAFGVSFANVRALGKKIGLDTRLALELWATGNHDARILATIVADPKEMSSAQLDAWSKDLSNYVLCDALSGVAARSPHALAKWEKWSASKNEWIGRAGWTVLAHVAMNDRTLPDAFFEERLESIERDIHQQKNYTRYGMNGALIAIGGRGGALMKRALDASKRIGTVEVDHGETGCKTPDAAPYIRKMVERSRAKAAKKPAAKKPVAKKAPAR
jgi:3-methyladenine DNA glycosylase AlkD